MVLKLVTLNATPENVGEQSATLSTKSFGNVKPALLGRRDSAPLEPVFQRYPREPDQSSSEADVRHAPFGDQCVERADLQVQKSRCLCVGEEGLP